jgi:hypothetical protein
MTRDEMNRLVSQVLELDPKFKRLSMRFPEKRQIVPEAGASGQSLQRVATLFPGGRLPPSYAMLLGLHDGIDNFKFVDSSILSAEQLIAAGEDGRTNNTGDKEPNRIFFIVGEDWEGVAFDKTAIHPDGEMDVVEYDNTGEIDRWHSLPDFLTAYLNWLETAYEEAIADRQQSTEEEK